MTAGQSVASGDPSAAPGLFSPLALRGVTLRNRVVTSPMWQYRGVNGHATEWHLMHLGRFAEGGASLVFQEATTVDAAACGTSGDLGIWDDAFVPMLRRIVDVVHDAGGLAGIQLGHPGRKAHQRPPWERGPAPAVALDDPFRHRFAPSPPGPDRDPTSWKAMTLGDIEQVRQDWRSAVVRADAAGYDVLEIHAAHGYLLHTFLSPGVNQRKDDYGGSFENRTRFLREVVCDARGLWPAHKPLFVRLSCVDGAGWDMSDTVRLAHVLADSDVDIVDCSSGGISGSSLDTGASPNYGYQVPFAAEVRRKTAMRTMAVGLIVHARQADALIRGGEADLVAIGREMLLNPSWAVDAAHKLGIDPHFDRLPPRLGYWLGRRDASVSNFRTSTRGVLDV